MSWERRVVEAPPSLQWHCWRIVSATLFRRAFGRLGTGSVLVSPRKLHGVDRISIGADCSIYQKAWLHVDGAGSITIGDRAYFAHDVHIHSVDPITIGNGCLIGAGSLIVSAEHTRGDRHGIVPSGAITIGDDVFIGDRSTILGGVTIGDGASVGAGAVVTRDVPPGATVVGPRAKITGEVDE